MRIRTAFAAPLCAALLASCGGGDADKTATTPKASDDAAELAAIKDYLLQHTERLKAETATIREGAEGYYEQAKAVDFDYAKLLQSDREGVKSFVESAQKGFQAANPAYEEMEGVVAGVPELADFDVIIDAGSDGSDPESAVPFSVKTPDGRTFKQPGNYNYLIETSVFGTDPKFAAKGVKADLDGDGKVSFGEAVPDANFYVAAARGFEKSAGELDAAARKWEPTPQDAFTALVVMTPTMSEYFEAWKNSRFISGNQAKEKAFVAASRLQDIGDILGGLELVYANIQPRVEQVSADQAKQTGQSLKELTAFAELLEQEEAGGKKFTPEEADTLGSEAQSRAEAIAGQISQAAGQLNIDIEN